MPISWLTISLSAMGNSLDDISITVHLTPVRPRADAYSRPSTPPPSMISESGNRSSSYKFSFVRYSTSESPGIDGITGLVPVAIMKLSEDMVFPSRETWWLSINDAWPIKMSIPIALNVSGRSFS